jgi:hypothetical protein
MSYIKAIASLTFSAAFKKERGECESSQLRYFNKEAFGRHILTSTSVVSIATSTWS